MPNAVSKDSALSDNVFKKKMSKPEQEMIIFVLTVYIFLISFRQCFDGCTERRET